MHDIKLGIDWADDEAFYHQYYNTPPEKYIPQLSDYNHKLPNLNIYITSFDGLIYARFQIKTLRHFLSSKVNLRIIFCDTNSHINPQASHSLEKLCANQMVDYIKLPHNKFQDMDQLSFKLGTDMNWIWRNFIRKSNHPDYFGFLDQDCFLVKDCWNSIKLHLDRHGIYGLAWPQDPADIKYEYWLIHIMQNFFRYDYVEHVDLDFRPAGHIALDTGGCNWYTLFKNLNRHDHIQTEEIFEHEWESEFRHFTLHDDKRWLHIRNSTKPFTGHPHEKIIKEAYMTGVLNGILHNQKYITIKK